MRDSARLWRRAENDHVVFCQHNADILHLYAYIEVKVEMDFSKETQVF
jgi:hypothetical protein